MPKPEDLFRIFGILLLSLTSIGLVSRTAKAVFGRRGSGSKTANFLYDPDFGKNGSLVCPFLYGSDSEPYGVRFDRSPCFEKTLLQWYVPWARHYVWNRFENDNRKRLRKREEEKTALLKEEEKKTESEGEESIVAKENEKESESESESKSKFGEKEKSSRVVYTISAALLVASATFACWEVFKEKAKKPNAMEEAKNRGDRKFSLADFTVDRHLRRESRQVEMQQVQRQTSLDRSSKVTQTLIHQGSLDRAIPKFGSEAMKQQTLVRRCSFDCDLSGEDSSPDSRRKFRHFIRRH